MKVWKKGKTNSPVNNKYFATLGKYTMSWNDVKEFTLYSGNEFLAHGSRNECLEKFYSHNKQVKL